MVVDEEANKVEVDHVEEDLGGDKLIINCNRYHGLLYSYVHFRLYLTLVTAPLL